MWGDAGTLTNFLGQVEGDMGLPIDCRHTLEQTAEELEGWANDCEAFLGVPVLSCIVKLGRGELWKEGDR